MGVPDHIWYAQKGKGKGKGGGGGGVMQVLQSLLGGGGGGGWGGKGKGGKGNRGNMGMISRTAKTNPEKVAWIGGLEGKTLDKEECKKLKAHIEKLAGEGCKYVPRPRYRAYQASGVGVREAGQSKAALRDPRLQNRIPLHQEGGPHRAEAARAAPEDAHEADCECDERGGEEAPRKKDPRRHVAHLVKQLQLLKLPGSSRVVHK